MITFKLKFLLAFSLKDKSKKDKVVRENKEKQGGNKKNIVEDKDSPRVIRLEKSFSTAHIEYELIAGKCKYQVDVLCWSNAAKIYTSDGVKIFKTIAKDGFTFVPVCLVHQIKELSTDELILLQSSVIEFNVYTDKAKLGSAAKANKTEIVYLKEFDVGRTDFVEVYLEKFDLSMSLTSTRKSVKTIKNEAEDTASQYGGTTKNDTFTQMYYEDDFGEKLYEIIDFVTNEDASDDQLQFKDFVRAYNPNDVAKKPAKKETADKNAKKPKVEKSLTKVTLQMQGEIFFTDPNSVMFKIEHPKCEVSKFFVLLQVENLLTRSQKIYLNPIVIKTMHISHIPVEVLENAGYTDVCCKYLIPCIAECKTIEKPISEFIRFNESHIYFTHTLSKIKLLEFLESKRLVVEIYGVKKYPVQEADPKLFGEKKCDSEISKIHREFQKSCLKQEENVKSQDHLLAYCSYDLSSLLKNVWDFRGKAQLHNIERSRFTTHLNGSRPEVNENDVYCDFWTTYKMSTNSVNLAQIFKSINRESTVVLKEWMLIENDTSLNSEAYLLSPQAAALVLHQIPNTYKRLFFIALEKKVAIDCFAKILRHNQKIICDKLDSDNLLTGWVLDNGNHIAIYVEGPAIGYILNIWLDMDSYSVDEIKVFFNTDQAYEKRLYPMCNKWSGFFIVTLKVPLEYILKDQRVYVKGNVPPLCLQALTKLDQLFLTRTLKLMLQYDLFPSIEELACLDIEYGVPYGWKQLETGDSVSVTDSEIIQIENLSENNLDTW